MNPLVAGCDCAKCPFAKQGKPLGYVESRGPRRPKAMVVLDYPNRRDADSGEFLSGPTGEKFDEALEAAGLRRADLLFVHAVQCNPNEPRDNDEIKASRAACAPALTATLKAHEGLPTLVCGSVAMAALGKKGALSGKRSIRGFLDGNRIYTLAPAHAAWADPYMWGAFVEDVKRLGRMVRGELAPEPVLIVDADHHDIAALVMSAKLKAGDGEVRITVDVETQPANRHEPWTGKDATRAKLKQVGLGIADFGISVHMSKASRATMEMLRLVLADQAITFVFQNGPWFDHRVMARFGLWDLTWTHWEDTRDMRRAVSSTSKLGLGFQGSIATDIHAWKVGDDKFDEDSVEEDTVEDYGEEPQPAEQPVTQWDSGDLEKDGEYNALDCVVTARVDDMNCADMVGERRAGAPVDRLYEMHKGLSVLTAKMHTRGIYVDTQWRAFMMHCLEQSIAERKAEVLTLVQQPDFPLTANGMRSLIYKRHAKPNIRSFNLPDPYDDKMFTNEKKETISVNENNLLMLLVSGVAPPELVPILEAWWNLQGELKRYGYLKSALLDHATGPDGRLRPGWNSCGTPTMRFACSQPNVMNIEEALRHMLGPGPGMAIVHGDKAQLELRVMACVAEDDVLQKAINSGDVYSFDVIDWFGIDPAIYDKDVLHKKHRKACKIIHLGKQYGAGDTTVWKQALRQDQGFKYAQVRVLGQKFEKSYHRTRAYWDEEMARVMALGYSEGRVLGGRKYWPLPPERSECVNFPIQRSASEMMNEEALELDRRLSAECPRAGINIQVHDALDVECPEVDAERVKAIMSEVMNREVRVGNRTAMFPVEIKIAYSSRGDTWAQV